MRVGTIGFCRGGSQAILAAGVAPELVVSAIAVYPTRLLQDTPDTGYFRWFSSVRAEVKILCPGIDPLFPKSDVEAIARLLDAMEARYQIRIYPGAMHGWNFASRPEYSSHADRDTWNVAFDAWERLLVVGEAAQLGQPRIIEIPDPSMSAADPRAS
jgi:carboxymethylenebutenolidase